MCANQDFVDYSMLGAVPEFAYSDSQVPPKSGPTFVLSSTSTTDSMMRGQHRRHVNMSYGKAEPVFSTR